MSFMWFFVLVLVGPHFSEYLYFTVTEDCTVMLVCKVTKPRNYVGFPVTLSHMSDVLSICLWILFHFLFLCFLVKTKSFNLCTCQVANVKKESTLHWYKDDEEIVPDTPPNVMSGSCALPLPLVTSAQSTLKNIM